VSVDLEPLIARALARLDHAELAARYLDEEMVFVPELLDGEPLALMQEEASRLGRGAYRAWVPFVRKAGAVGQMDLARDAPALTALYRSPLLLDYLRRLTGVALEHKATDDAHAASLYVYTRPRDHVTWHYDDCGCEVEASFTANLGVIDRSSSRVDVQLFRGDRGREVRARSLVMTPGSLLFFCGTKAYHRVTPLGRGEERIVYSMAYVRQGKRLSGWKRARQRLYDAAVYFGPRGL
jgi:hypothetical protein